MDKWIYELREKARSVLASLYLERRTKTIKMS